MMNERKKRRGLYKIASLFLIATILAGPMLPSAAENDSAVEIQRFEQESPVAVITVEMGTADEQLSLPKTLSAVLTKTASASAGTATVAATGESTVDIPVTWDDGGSYDPSKAGVYTFTANIGDYVFSGALPTLTVEVKSAAVDEVLFYGTDTPLEMYKKTMSEEEKNAFLVGSVYACGESDTNVRYPVIVKDDGGFDPEKEGEYVITLAAMSGQTELGTATRAVTVHGEDTYMLCSCGAGDHAATHSADCAILKIPQVVEVFKAKAEGTNGDELPDSVEVPNSVLNEISEQNKAALTSSSEAIITESETQQASTRTASSSIKLTNMLFRQNGKTSALKVNSARSSGSLKSGSIMALAATGGQATTEIVVPRGVVYLSPNPETNAAGTYKWYDTVAAAEAAMNSSTTDYTMIIAQNGYAMTAAECDMTGLAGRAKSLSISTSWKDPAGADTLWDRDPATWVPGTTSLGYQGSPSDAGTITLGADLQLGVPTTFRNIVFGTQKSILAHSNKLVMGEGITMSSSTLYLNLWGDNNNVPYVNDKTKSIEVFSGQYALICGGGRNYPMGMHGNKNVSIYGGNISSSTGGVGGSENVNGAVYCDAIDDDTGTSVSTSTGQNTLLVQPLQGLAFTAPAAISITRWSAGGSANPSEYDHLTVDTRYYNAPVDLSNTAVAGASSSADSDFARKNVVVDIYAPDATIKSVTARNLISNYNVFPSTINIHDAKYIGLVQGADNNNMLDYNTVKHADINISGDVTIGTLQWYTDCNLSENANVTITTKHQSGIRQDASPWSVLNNNIQNLRFGKNSTFKVMVPLTDQQTNVIGNIYTAQGAKLILTSRGPLSVAYSEGACLSGRIYVVDGNKLTLGLSSASAPNQPEYVMMYSGARTFSTTSGLGTTGTFQPEASTYTVKDDTTYSPPRYLLLSNSETNYYEISVAGGNPATVKKATLSDVVSTINSGSYVGKVVKIRLLNNRMDDSSLFSNIQEGKCAGIIFTGWSGDFGYNIKGDGQQTSGETTVDNDAGDGSAAQYKSVNPPNTYGFTTSTTSGSDWKNWNMNVPLTMRNIGLNQVQNTYLNGRGYRLQMGPGLVHTTNGRNFELYGNEQTSTDTSSAGRGGDVTIYNGTYVAVAALGRTPTGSGTTTWNPGSTGTANIILRVYGCNKIANTDNVKLNGFVAVESNGYTASVTGDVEVTVAPTDGYDFSMPSGADIMAGNRVTGQNYTENFYGNIKVNLRVPANRGSLTFYNVAPVETSTSNGCPAGKTWTTTIDAPNCAFHLVSAANSYFSEISGLGARVLNLVSAKSITSGVYGTNIMSSYTSLVNQSTTINIGGTKGTDTAARTFNTTDIKNWNALNIQNGAVVNVSNTDGLTNDGKSATVAYTAAQDALNTMNIKEYARLNLTSSGGNRTYGVNNIESSDGTGTLAIYPNSTTDAGLRVKGANLMPGGNKLKLDLVSGVTAVPNMKLLTFVKTADGKVPMGWSDADATGNGGTPLLKGSAFSAFKYGIISSYPSTGFTNNTLILAADEGAVRLYAATANGGRYANYKSLAALIADLNKEDTNPEKDHVYQINFYKNYTLTAEDVAALKALNRSDITSLTISTVNQATPDLFSENNTNSPKLTTLSMASGVNALELPAAADVLKGDGKELTFESFAFGGINTVYGNGCNVNYGVPGAANNAVGSVRMGSTDANGNATIPTDPESQNFTIYTGGTADVAANPVVNLYDGVYRTVNLGGNNATVTNSTVNLFSAAKVSTLTGGDKSTETSLAVVKEANTINNATNLDKLKTEASLTVKNNLDLAASNATNGELYIGQNTTVDLQSTTATLKAGALSAESSAKLYIPKTGASTSDTTGTTNPLIVSGTYTSVSGTKLGTDVKEVGMRAQGDHLIRFTTTSPGKANFVSTSMGIKEDNVYPNVQQVILYGPPANPQARLWLVGEADPVKADNATLAKKLFIDTFVFDTVSDTSNDASDNGTAIHTSDVYILAKAQYDAYTADPASFDWTSAVAHSSTIAAQGVNNGLNGTLANDGIGDGTHTHYYFELDNVTIDETKEYYVAAKAGTGQTQAIGFSPVDVNAPVNSSTAELTQKATLNADKTQYTVTVNLNEFTGLADASGIRRYGWSTTRQFGDNVNVTAPSRSILSRTYETTGSWGTVFEAGKYQELATAASTQAVSMTLPFSSEMPASLYLYVQDDLGNTREIIVTPQWSDKTITFDLNGGNWSGSTANRIAPVDSSGAIINPDLVWPANPTQNGKIFVGWWSVTDAANINDSGTVRYYKQYSPYADGTILHAVWVDDTDSNSDGIADALQAKLTYTPSTVLGGSINVSTAGQAALTGSGSATGKYSKDDTTGVITETLNRGNLTYTQLNDLYGTNISQWDSASTADAVTLSLKKSLGAATLTANMIPSANANAGYSFYGWNPTALAAGDVTQNTNYTAQFTAVIPTGILLGGGRFSVPAVLTLFIIGAIAAGSFLLLKKRRKKSCPRHDV